MRLARRYAAVALLSQVICLSAVAQSPDSAKPNSPAAPAAPRLFETNHEGVFGGQSMRYKAVVAENILTDGSGRRAASVFTTSYFRTDGPKDRVRPVIFAFNGGPGSASIWLHMGLLGPRRVDFANVLEPETAPPFRLVDNPDSPLDVADIVLIDPPGTGFSRVLPDGKPEEFYGTAQDANVTVELIERWVRQYGRWNAPKYFLSESYGTVRAAVVARLLAGGPTETGKMNGMTLNGIILLGQALNLDSSPSDDLSYVNLLPTFAATACFHGKGPAGCTANTQIAAARRFAADEYLKALYAGSGLPPRMRDSIVAELAALTGLSPQLIRQNELRVDAAKFSRELLGDQEKQVGAYDSRYTMPIAASGNDPVADDPAMGQYVPAFIAAYNMYARRDLNVSLEENYEPIAFRSVNARWDWGSGPGVRGPGRNYASDLAIAMRRNSRLRLMIGTGYFDMVTPLGSADYVVSHSGIPLSNTEVHSYPSGHMPYLGSEARTALIRDIRAFITAEHAATER